MNSFPKRQLLAITLYLTCAFSPVWAVSTFTVNDFSQSAVQAAVKACSGGGTVFFPEGTYTLRSTVELSPGKCTFSGVRSKSILVAPPGMYAFHAASGSADGDTFSNLVFQNGGLNFDWANSVAIDHNVFKDITTRSAIAMPGGMDTVTIDSNIQIGYSCTSSCGGGTPGFVYTTAAVRNTRITNNYIDGVYQGISLGGERTAIGSNNAIDNNTILHPIRMGIESTTPLNNTSFSNNFVALWRTQNESVSPNGAEERAQFRGQNPVQGCPNYGNGSPQNRYDCNSFGISIVGGGSNDIIHNNRVYGVPGVSWGAEIVVNSGSFSGNVIMDTALDIWDDDQNLQFRPFITGNISCGGLGGNAANKKLFGASNSYSGSCSDRGGPSVQNIPPMPFTP
jgi:hypothetical protein